MWETILCNDIDDDLASTVVNNCLKRKIKRNTEKHDAQGDLDHLCKRFEHSQTFSYVWGKYRQDICTKL